MIEFINLAALDIVGPTEVIADFVPILLFPILAVVLIAVVVVFALILRNNARKRNATHGLAESAKPITPPQEEESSESRDSAENDPK